ncbi:hypothetical protein ACFLXT_03770 [Chloroflexota bacterium]
MGPTEEIISMTIYKEDLVNRYWAYQRAIYQAITHYIAFYAVSHSWGENAIKCSEVTI